MALVDHTLHNSIHFLRLYLFHLYTPLIFSNFSPLFSYSCFLVNFVLHFASISWSFFFSVCVLASMADTGASGSGRRMWCYVPERLQLHMAMLALQFGYAGFHVVSRAALNMGISKLVFPVYRNIIALLLLLPFAYFLEKYITNIITTKSSTIYTSLNDV